MDVSGVLGFDFEHKGCPTRKIKEHAIWFVRLTFKIKSESN